MMNSGRCMETSILAGSFGVLVILLGGCGSTTEAPVTGSPSPLASPLLEEEDGPVARVGTKEDSKVEGAMLGPQGSGGPNLNRRLRPDAPVLAQAKPLLSDSYSVNQHTRASGESDDNVKKGIALLTEYLTANDLLLGDTDERYLLQHAKVALNDQMAIRLLTMLDEYDVEEIDDDYDWVIFVDKSRLDMLSPGFSKHFDTYKKTGEAVLRAKGSQDTHIARAFSSRLKKNMAAAVALRRKAAIAEEKRQKAAREENPKLTGLIFDVQENLNLFAGKCMYFDDFKLGGLVTKKGDNDYRLSVEDSRGEIYSSSGFSDAIIFTTTKAVAGQMASLLTEVNAYYSVKLYCQMYKTNKDTPWALVYKIDVYNVGGKVSFTMKDE